MKAEKDIQGNAILSQQQYQSRLVRAAETILRLEGHMAAYAAGGVELLGMSLRPPDYAGGDWLLTSRWTQEGARFVAFTSGEDLLDVVRSFVAAVENRSLKMKEDRYAK